MRTWLTFALSGVTSDGPDTGKSGTVDTLTSRGASTTAVHVDS